MAGPGSCYFKVSSFCFSAGSGKAPLTRLPSAKMMAGVPCTINFLPKAKIVSMGVSHWAAAGGFPRTIQRSEEHTSELQSLMRISYAVFCLKKKIIFIYEHDSVTNTNM